MADLRTTAYERDIAAIYNTDESYARRVTVDVCTLLRENAKLRAVAEAASARCRAAVPEWAPELRAALAALEAP